MEPLSYKRRALYLALIVLLFAAVLPMALLYASGYRWKDGTGLVRTGGVFISVPYSGANVYIDGVHVGTAGFLRHDFYIDNLVPDAYSISVESEGSRTWEHLLIVEEQLVTDARALMVPEKIEMVELLVATTSSTTTRAISEGQLEALEDLFAVEPATTTQGALDELRGEGVFVEGGDVFVRWLDARQYSPSHFCGRPSFCSPEIVIERGSTLTATYAEFFEGGVVYVAKEGGVFFVEADVRPNQVNVELFKGKNLDFRIEQGRLIVQSGERFFEVLGL